MIHFDQGGRGVRYRYLGNYHFLFKIPHEFTITEDGLEFMICDVEIPGPDGMVIGFVSPNRLGLLGHSDEVFGDGSFEINTLFYQLLVACVKG